MWRLSVNAWRLHIGTEQDQILACGTVCTINIKFLLSTESVEQFRFTIMILKRILRYFSSYT